MDVYRDLFGKICRICLTLDNSKTVSLFDGNNELSSYGKAVFTTTGVQITKVQSAPPNMCFKCLHQLQQCILFRKKCQISQNFFSKSKEEESSRDTVFKILKSNGNGLLNDETAEKKYLNVLNLGVNNAKSLNINDTSLNIKDDGLNSKVVSIHVNQLCSAEYGIDSQNDNFDGNFDNFGEDNDNEYTKTVAKAINDSHLNDLNGDFNSKAKYKKNNDRNEYADVENANIKARLNLDKFKEMETTIKDNYYPATSANIIKTLKKECDKNNLIAEIKNPSEETKIKVISEISENSDANNKTNCNKELQISANKQLYMEILPMTKTKIKQEKPEIRESLEDDFFDFESNREQSNNISDFFVTIEEINEESEDKIPDHKNQNLINSQIIKLERDSEKLRKSKYNEIYKRMAFNINKIEAKRNPNTNNFETRSRNLKEVENKKRNKTVLIPSPSEIEDMICKICSKKFMTKLGLKRHLIVHNENSPFVCEHCGKGFTQQHQMKRHCRSQHGMERVHNCLLCPFKAVDGQSLKHHTRREHTGEKPYVCEYCSASFFRRLCLIQHLDSHINTTANIKCEQCSGFFKSPRHLNRHKFYTHTSKLFNYQCPACSQIYKSMKYARVHMRKVHSLSAREHKIIKIKL